LHYECEFKAYVKMNFLDKTLTFQE